MGITGLADIASLWRRFLIEKTFARGYKVAYMRMFAPPNPILERLLPSLLHIKAVAILDHALRAFIDANGMTVPRKPYGGDLRGRIEFLADGGQLADRTTLHGLRSIRNDLAHEPDSAIAWADLDRDLAAINGALQELKLVGDMPTFTVQAEQSEAQDSPDPKVNCVIRYRFMVMEAGQVVAEIPWEERFLKDDA